MAKWWQYWIPGLGHYLAWQDTKKTGNPFAWLGNAFGKQERESSLVGSTLEDQASDLYSQVVNNSRSEFLADREHTEAREDTAFQRAVKDMSLAGLNPYTVGASPSASSSSNVGENLIASKVQMLGYILDLKNLDVRNKQVANQALGNIIRVVEKSSSK